ncbi:cytochrome c oxidase assembly factor 4 homolog, mitochondrial [Dunckerocampus dactyliophorus]|uniref:cytochrome c oxidase assembly factor 4 homolog, mitochondrial n=1 Tax=Dunckerocampus dactyliophorus TaxID=161453 RepID=UPI002404F47C|nr:cytochrome c oxidase assembly factor 4 homolog, mitochondrial [Dunckerocampus dactyliophorus]XP_054610327.1 cytochrome c oxidase assembly factor 4 homolog, mitochondrial [Dunckerocampus dactyliophorus]
MTSPSPHNRSRRSDDKDEDDPVELMISRTGCAELHYAVQECMAERQDWRACQTHVHAFKACMLDHQKTRMEELRKRRMAKAETTPS